ncbi:MAG: 30S ribosomal protein S18 [Candidatus Woykebacteria bacterium RBG_19FT_COMBO_43_10]|uniref:Small ribosomal subunit protein bS18 n=1 Tax=Candidatus Woykebacteria bacterium RBG_19FT_COMBO_43_10 TaxID=1802598 RepID=A0A1G1WJL7_9BACT|nr:MAG: 30S ribosomal protein S18 [Candidatus Woykebacteria bacterium RBG_19FT_COMBO_43_10]
MAITKYTRVYRKKACSFCKTKNDPIYKDVETLRNYTTERGKILSRARSGTCAAHQRKLATAIKRARILALLPFVPRI